MITRTTTIEKLKDKDFAGKELLVRVESLDKPGELPDKFLVTKVEEFKDNDYYLHYYCPATKKRAAKIVPKSLKLAQIIEAEKAEIQKAWEVEKVGASGSRLDCTVGADPEIFAVDSKGYIIPAWTYLPSKEYPIHFTMHNGGYSKGTAYWDGFQAEFTTKAGVECLLWLSDNIHIGLKTIHEAAKKVGGKLTIDNVLPVNPEVLESAAEEHVQFGCAPSSNAYGLRGALANGRDTPYRFAGGHLHFGLYGTKTDEQIQKYVKALDMILGVASVSLLGELDSPIRRKFYGLPGEYRTPKHGFEYRTLSNAWLCHPLAMNIVYDLARSVCGLARKGLLKGWECDEKETLEIIINNDVKKARKVLARNKQMFRQICKVIGSIGYREDNDLDLAYKVWVKGISSVVKDPKDVVGNWGLDGNWTEHGDGLGKNWATAYRLLHQGEKV